MEGFLAPLSPRTFFGEYWDRKPVLLSPSDGRRDYGQLFSLEDLENLVAASALDCLIPSHVQLLCSGQSVPRTSSSPTTNV